LRRFVATILYLLISPSIMFTRRENMLSMRYPKMGYKWLMDSGLFKKKGKGRLHIITIPHFMFETMHYLKLLLFWELSMFSFGFSVYSGLFKYVFSFNIFFTSWWWYSKLLILWRARVFCCIIWNVDIWG